MISRSTVSAQVVLVCAALPATASTLDVDTRLQAEIIGSKVDFRLIVINRSSRNLCFDNWARPVVMFARDGTLAPNHLGNLDQWGRTDDVQVAWNDRMPHHFDLITGVGTPFETPEEARQVSRVTYHLAMYDCQALFSTPNGTLSVHPVLKRDLSALPVFKD